MANLYRKYMRLLDKWPIDKNKAQDLGQHIREQVKIAFAKGENTKIEDNKKCQRQLESLERIASDYYSKKYPHPFKQTATGLTPEQCTAALSKEFLEYIQEQKVGFFGRLKQKIKGTFSKESEAKNLKV